MYMYMYVCVRVYIYIYIYIYIYYTHALSYNYRQQHCLFQQHNQLLVIHGNTDRAVFWGNFRRCAPAKLYRKGFELSVRISLWSEGFSLWGKDFVFLVKGWSLNWWPWTVYYGMFCAHYMILCYDIVYYYMTRGNILYRLMIWYYILYHVYNTITYYYVYNTNNTITYYYVYNTITYYYNTIMYTILIILCRMRCPWRSSVYCHLHNRFLWGG